MTDAYGSSVALDWMTALGRLHPMVLHLPIGLWIGVGVIELGGSLLRRAPSRGVVMTLAALAAVTGCLAAASGWLLADPQDPSVDWHRYAGVTVAALGCLALALLPFTRAGFRILLGILLVALVPTGHWGAILTHGDDYWRADDSAALNVVPQAASQPSLHEVSQTPPTAADPTELPTAIADVFGRYCVDCHGPTKRKGQLALDTWANIQKGGKSGPALQPGDLSSGEILRRTALPIAHKQHMPPKNKPQPLAEEWQRIQDWIAAGAPLSRQALAPLTAAPVTAPKVEPPSKPTAPPEALAALRQALVHVAPFPGADPSELWVDTAAVAGDIDDAAVQRLLAPVTAQVVDLALAHSKITDESLRVVAQMQNLRKLDLRGTAITSDGLSQLQSMPRLQHLVLVHTRLDERAVEMILGLATLERVFVWACGLSPAGIERLRAKASLHVDAGELAGEALESEPVVEFSSNAPLPDAAPAGPTELAASNALCPVAQKPVNPSYVEVFDGKLIGFCCADCPKRFWAQPDQYPIASQDDPPTSNAPVAPKAAAGVKPDK